MENKFIFQLWMMRPTEAYYALSQEESRNLDMKVYQALEDSGGKGLMVCDSRWSSERWMYYGVNRFPNLQAMQNNMQRLGQLNWHRYTNAQSYIGTEILPTVYDIPAPNGDEMIFKMFLVRPTEAFYALALELRNDLLEAVGKRLETARGKSLVMCDMRWSNEQWLAFGVELFPNLDCVQQHTQMLTEMDWYRYAESEVLLGVMQRSAGM